MIINKKSIYLSGLFLSFFTLSFAFAFAMDINIDNNKYVEIKGNRVKARLSNVDLDSWITCPQDYQQVMFDRFNGEILEPPRTHMLIMEDGRYSLSAKYAWKNISGYDPEERPGQAKTHIQISDDLETVRKIHSIPKNGRETGTLTHTCNLKKGDLLCVTLYGNGHEQYGTKEFDLSIEKVQH